MKTIRTQLMAKLLRFALFSAALLAMTQQVSAQPIVSIHYVTSTGIGPKNGTSWTKILDSTQFQIVINSAATSMAANPGDDGLVWMSAARIIPPLETSQITSSS
ncbi:hypothetical protein [Spirosoma validum]|uniref:Uncharacterized protein n=1 Tax=Spirosoma validum TaxID=2771355 RepID=A0A927B801_9BACT|nr:hypothetical protein [Spirosoma validum]MBD2757416.1 hypothetical protein [Spirosoma validum]